MSNPAPAIASIVAGSAVRPVIPADFGQVVCMAKTAVHAGLFQDESEDKALAQATMAVLQGLELGLPPMQAVQQIAIIGGRCTVWGDLIPAMVWRAGHKIKEWIEGEGDARVAWCEIARADNAAVIQRKFSVDDAKRAGLWDTRDKVKRKGENGFYDADNDNPWYRYPERMLQMRARGFCARDGVPDVLRGLYIREEMEEERRLHEARDTTPSLETADLWPPPAPGEVPDAPPVTRAEVPSDLVRNADDFLLDLDVSLASCKIEEQLDEVWSEQMETIGALGRKERNRAEMMYERHQSRITGQAKVLREAPSVAIPGELMRHSEAVT